MKQINAKYLLIIPLLILITAFVYMANSDESKNITVGFIESTTIDVSSKIPGRLENILIQKGSPVKKGDTLAILESKEMLAKVEQARGAKEAAYNKYMMALNGARIEEKKAVEQLYLQAKEQYLFAEKTWNRFQNLYEEKAVSLHEKDEVEFKYNAAKSQMEAAKAKLDMVNNGAREEEKAAAKALFHQAENAFNEASAYLQELTIISPVNGIVSNIIADEGEIVNSGYPIISIQKENESYAILQIREDRLNGLNLGDKVKGFLPALGKISEFKVSYISPLADFATWKPTNQKGEFDLKTFEIHLVQLSNDNIKPGMTVQFEL